MNPQETTETVDLAARVTPIVIGGLVAALLGFVSQLILTKRNRAANRQDRYAAHLEDAVAALAVSAAALRRELITPTSPDTRKDFLATLGIRESIEASNRLDHVLAALEAEIAVAAGWAQRANDTKFRDTLLELRSHATAARHDEQKGRAQAFDVLEFVPELCSAWLLDQGSISVVIVENWAAEMAARPQEDEDE